MDEPAIRKQELRTAIRAARASEAASTASARAAGLAAHAGDLAPWADAGVAAFLPTNEEPDVGPLLRALAVPVYVPRIEHAALAWVRCDPDSIRGMRRGVPRPDGRAMAHDADVVAALGVRLVLVPALAVDPADGTRLGYGAGWYDRLLAAIRRHPDLGVRAVGVCRAVDLVAVPSQAHDEPVDGVLTEDGLVWLRRHS